MILTNYFTKIQSKYIPKNKNGLKIDLKRLFLKFLSIKNYIIIKILNNKKTACKSGF